MGLIRTAIVAGICISLIPAEQKDREALYQRVEAAVAWSSTFCTRNAKTCENAEVMWDAFIDKASFALSSGYDIAIRQLADDRSVHGEPLPPVRPASHRLQQGTLTAEDRLYQWRGHPRDGGT